jgi:biotin carboxyl carrier protein
MAAADEAIASLRACVDFDGETPEFWPKFLEAAVANCTGSWGIIAMPVEDRWKQAAIHPKGMGAPIADLPAALSQLQATCITAEVAHLPGKGKEHLIAVSLDVGTTNRPLLVIVCQPANPRARNELLARLRLCALIAVGAMRANLAQQADDDSTRFASVMDLVLLLNDETRFRAAAMTCCAELVSQTDSDRVSLGWADGRYARLACISHSEKFERKMSAVKQLEDVLEESMDMDEELVWPPPAGQPAVARQLEQYVRETGLGAAAVVPLRIDGKPVAAVLCERLEGDYDENEIRYLRLALDQGARRLSDLHDRDRWFGARFLRWSKDRLGRLLGVEHTGAKLVAIIVLAVLLVLCLGSKSFRVEAPFSVVSDTLVFVPSPFDGYIDEVNAEPGDKVESGAPLLSLDTRELLLEVAAADSERYRYQREAEKARGEGELAAMRIAEAMASQSASRLALLRHRLAQADIVAPFAGVLVEGDLKERRGSPVRQGDILMKIAQLEGLSMQLKVDERDIHYVAGETIGEIAFASQPKLKFPIVIERIEPAARADAEGNTVIVRCRPEGEQPDWWRPGMTGIAKLDCGDRKLIWIFSRRTIDFLRMFLWW